MECDQSQTHDLATADTGHTRDRSSTRELEACTRLTRNQPNYGAGTVDQEQKLSANCRQIAATATGTLVHSFYQPKPEAAKAYLSFLDLRRRLLHVQEWYFSLNLQNKVLFRHVTYLYTYFYQQVRLTLFVGKKYNCKSNSSKKVKR